MSAPQNAHLPTVMCRHFTGISFEIAHLSFYVNFASKGRAKVRCWSQMCCYPPLTLCHTLLPSTELDEQNGHPGSRKDGDKKVQGQRQGTAREQLRSLWFAEQQLHLWLRHLSGEVHRWWGKKSFLPGVPWNLEGMKEIFHFSEASHRFFFGCLRDRPYYQSIKLCLRIAPFRQFNVF